MIDNPKTFIILIVSTVLVLSVIIAGVQIFSGNPAEDISSTAEQMEQVASTTGIAPSPTQKPTQTETRTPQGGVVTSLAAVYDGIVTYTSSGFRPKTIEVKAGATVRFINKSNMPMRVVATESSETLGDGGPNQSKSVSYGGTYDYHFSKTGTWLYENLNDQTKVGAVVVK